ncbi:hypothetical protein KL943_002701 [Ogataea angusta]|nr:hypothetical protein KL943_002701 [Ogataea angusta]
MLSPSSKESHLVPSNQNRLSNFTFGEKKHSLSKVESSHDPAEHTTQRRGTRASSIGNANVLNSPLSLSDEDQCHRANSNLDGDQISLESVPPPSTPSSPSQSRSNASRGSHSKRKDSLIFERFVQDQLIDSQPISSSLPRQFSTENFVPASLDLTAQISHDELDQVDMRYPRRSSTANLQAAFASPGYRKMSISSRPSTKRSTSNLTEQLTSNQSPRPAFSHSLTTSSIPQAQQNSPATSPLLKQNKSTLSFCSYADMITQEDQESKIPIRRPSISASLSNHPRLSRTSSVSSTTFSQRSPVSAQVPQIHTAFGPNASAQASSSSLSPCGGPISPQIFARGPLGQRTSSVQSGKKFSVDLPSSDSDNETDQSSIPFRFTGLQKKKIPVRLSNASQHSFKSGTHNIDDVLVDDDSDEDSMHGYVNEGLRT